MLKNAAPLLAEFVGTFMLVFTVACNSLTKSSAALAPLSIASAVLVLTYAFGAVSGGHLNPAVTLSAGLAGRMQWLLVLSYILAQLSGGVLAGISCSQLFKPEAVMTGPRPSFAWWEAMVVEVIYTATLAFVALSVASQRNNPDRSRNQFYGLAVSFTVVAGGYAAGPISGPGAFNPAVSLGLDIVSTEVLPGVLYVIYQCFGAGLAAILFQLTRPEEYMSEEEYLQYEVPLQAKLTSEFIGTFILVLTMGLCVLGTSPATAWSVAAAYMSMIYALGDISGGHFNPAVTLAVVLSKRGKCSALHGLAYMVIQAAAGVLASLLYAGLFETLTFPVGPKPPFKEGAAYVLEVGFTFVISFVVLSTHCVTGIATPLRRNFYFALAIGASAAAGGHATASVSGGLLNPAASFGIGIVSKLNSGGLYYCWNFILAEYFGGLAAAIIFYVTHAREYNSHGLKQQQLRQQQVK
mmetsp:Transcript_79580/g.170633  ORF Transcript_79580/g.170633 Transcript_79580/m.170633 type:complete len:466 (-) Transcript_79580:102-1499(-)